MTDGFKVWHQWQPDGADPGSVLAEVARHMRNAWEYRDDPGNTRFKAGHQLAHKGWKFPSGVVDLADGSTVAGIKALRALIIAGRHDWFERAASRAPGDDVGVDDAPSPIEAVALSNMYGPMARFRRIDLGEAQLWMLPDAAGWRIAIMYVNVAEGSGIKDVLQLASATHGGCALALGAAWLLFVFAIHWGRRTPAPSSHLLADGAGLPGNS